VPEAQGQFRGSGTATVTEDTSAYITVKCKAQSRAVSKSSLHLITSPIPTVTTIRDYLSS
jgi:hypothetical protein